MCLECGFNCIEEIIGTVLCHSVVVVIVLVIALLIVLTTHLLD